MSNEIIEEHKRDYMNGERFLRVQVIRLDDDTDDQPGITVCRVERGYYTDDGGQEVANGFAIPNDAPLVGWLANAIAETTADEDEEVEA